MTHKGTKRPLWTRELFLFSSTGPTIAHYAFLIRKLPCLFLLPRPASCLLFQALVLLVWASSSLSLSSTGRGSIPSIVIIQTCIVYSTFPLLLIFFLPIHLTSRLPFLQKLHTSDLVKGYIHWYQCWVWKYSTLPKWPYRTGVSNSF